jgi:hypothetical protein
MNLDQLLHTIANSATIIESATVYRARVGRRREYKSATAALEYERGYNGWPRVPDGNEFDAHREAALSGFFDAEKEQEIRADERADRVREERDE